MKQFSMVKNLTFLITISAISSLGMSAENHEAERTVHVKILNKTKHAVKVVVNDDETKFFGIGKRPVIYAEIPFSEVTHFQFQEISDSKVTQEAYAKTIYDNGQSAFTSARGGLKLWRDAAAAAKEAQILKDEMLLRAMYLKEADGTPFKEFYWNAKMTKDASKVAGTAKAAMGLGIANIGFSAVDWACGDGYFCGGINVNPSMIRDLQENQILIIEVHNTKLKTSKRYKQAIQDTITCLVESQSKFPIMCKYTDQNGDESQIRLHKDKFPKGEIKVRPGNPIQITEMVDYDRSFFHGCMDAGKCGLNVGVAILDPSKLSLFLSLTAAATNAYSAVNILNDRARANRNYSLTLNEYTNKKLLITDSGDYEINVDVQNFSNISEIGAENNG